MRAGMPGIMGRARFVVNAGWPTDRERSRHSGMIFRWFKERRRRRLLATPAPDWPAVFDRELELWSRLDAPTQRRLLDITRVLVAEKTWEGAGGFVLGEREQAVIAAQAALLLVGLRRHDYYPNIASVVVYPSTYMIPGFDAGPGGVVVEGTRAVLGTAHRGGAVVLSWRSAREGGREADDGRNLVFHEFAHALDMLDGVIDGTPPLPDAKTARTWFEVMTRYYERLVAAAADGRRRTLLDTYGATNVAEFFAVATEAFFEKPRQMKRKLPDLYAVMQAFYHQDPAGWPVR